MFALSRLIPSSSSSPDAGRRGSSPSPAVSSRSPSSPQYKELTLLLSRLSSSTLHEDRLAAIASLHELTGQYPDLPLSQSALEQLLALADDMQRHDADISRMALQCIHHLLQRDDGSSSSAASASASDRSSQLELFSLFASHPPFVHLLLSFLSSQHFHVRFTAMQMLTLLLLEKASRDRTQQILIAAPGAVLCIVELLESNAEIIRNESLLLLEALVQKDADIQKMVAFNGGFDLLMMAVRREGGVLDSGVVGEDAMRIVAALLRDNRSNQQLFAEMGSVKLLALLLLPVPPALSAGGAISSEALSTLCFMLDVVSYVSASASLSSLAPLVPSLADIAMLPSQPAAIRYAAMSLLCALIDGNKHCQQTLASHPLPAALASSPNSPSAPLPFLLALALDSPDPLLSRLSCFAVQAFHHNNKDGQLQAVFSFTPPAHASASVSPATLGSLLLQAFFTARPVPPTYSAAASASPSRRLPPYQTRCRLVSTAVLSSLVRDSRDCQLMLIKMPIGEEPATGRTVTWQDSFVDALLAMGAGGGGGGAGAAGAGSQSLDGVLVEVSMLSLLCDWMDGCTEAVEALYGRPSVLQLVVTLATTHSNEYVRGLAAYTFLIALHIVTHQQQHETAAAAAASSASPSPFLSASSLLALLQHSISLELFKSSILSLYSSAAFKLIRSSSPRELIPFTRYTQRRLKRGGDVHSEHFFVLQDEEAEMDDGDDPAFVFSRAFVLRFDKAVEGMNDGLLSLLTSALLSRQTAATGQPAGASALELSRLQHENAQLKAENETLRSRLRQQPQLNGRSDDREREMLHSTVAQQREEIAALTKQLQEAQSRVAAAPSSSSSYLSSAARALQQKYDELQAEHEDLLILLATYAQAEEEQKQQGENERPAPATPSVPAPSAAAATAASQHWKQREEEKMPQPPPASSVMQPVSTPALESLTAAVPPPVQPSHPAVFMNGARPPSFFVPQPPPPTTASAATSVPPAAASAPQQPSSSSSYSRSALSGYPSPHAYYAALSQQQQRQPQTSLPASTSRSSHYSSSVTSSQPQ